MRLQRSARRKPRTQWREVERLIPLAAEALNNNTLPALPPFTYYEGTNVVKETSLMTLPDAYSLSGTTSFGFPNAGNLALTVRVRRGPLHADHVPDAGGRHVHGL